MITRLFVPSARNRDIGTLTYNTDYHFRCFARCGRILSLPCWNEHKRNRSVLHERSRSKCLKRSSESSGRLLLRPRSSFARSLRGLLCFHSNGTSFLLSRIISLITIVSIIDARAYTRRQKMEVKVVPTRWINSNRAYPRKANRGNEAECPLDTWEKILL